jgi:CheY-like chemotaxis protein
MPGPVRSPELARQTRVRLPDVAVLFTSGYTDNAIVHGGRLDQGIELLSKPYTREALAKKIRHVLRQQRQRSVGTVSVKRGPQPPSANHPRRRLTVLFVEDDDLIRMVTTDMLEGLGHAVFEAADARQALAVLKETPVSVLMTDIGLPGMSGHTLAVEARRLKPDLIVIFATGADDVPRGAMGADDEEVFLLRKPYDADSLDSVLQAASERRPEPR